VLLVGPTPVFLKYISQVLPSLGETGVVTATPEELLPGVTVTGRDDDAGAAIKGSLGMVEVLERAVQQRVRIPKAEGQLTVGSVTVPLRPRVMRSTAEAARRGGRTHNAARLVFVRNMLQHLIDLYANATGQPLESIDRSEVESKLRESRDVRRELNLAWPPLAASQVLNDLLSSPERLFAATPGWSNDDRAAILRRRGEGWTVADVALLDELADLVGDDDDETAAESQREHRVAADELRHAREVLETIGGQAAHLVSAEALAARFGETGPTFTVAERAFSDRTWTYGHVIVDEAQELSPMMWRLLLRRCPAKSFTVVGDMSQATGAASSASWDAALAPQVGDAWTRRDLTINYRTPAQVMDRACAMLTAAGHPTEPPTSVRDGEPPRWHQIASGEGGGDGGGDGEAVATLVAREVDELGDGRLAVISAKSDVGWLASELQPWLSASGDLQAPVVLLTADQVKGLEFDVVVIVDPRRISEDGPHGARGLFVALTRPTQRLVLAHRGDVTELPEGLTPSFEVQ
jgi:DNA helicase IV